jgi:hypothetical protein
MAPCLDMEDIKMSKKHLNTLINLANRFENLEEDKDLLLAKLKSFLKTLDKQELEELSDDLKQFPEGGEVSALLREIAGQHTGAKILLLADDEERPR